MVTRQWWPPSTLPQWPSPHLLTEYFPIDYSFPQHKEWYCACNESTINQLIMPPKCQSATVAAACHRRLSDKLVCIFTVNCAAQNQSATQVKTDSFVNADDSSPQLLFGKSVC